MAPMAVRSLDVSTAVGWGRRASNRSIACSPPSTLWFPSSMSRPSGLGAPAFVEPFEERLAPLPHAERRFTGPAADWQPVSEPLAALWNSPKAIAKRSDMISGRSSHPLSRQYCGWREGKSSPPRNIDAGREEWRELVRIQLCQQPEIGVPGNLALVRRLVAEERRKRSEVESYTRSLESLLANGQKHIDHLEAKVEKAVADFRRIEAAFAEYRTPWLVRAAHKASRILRTLCRETASNTFLNSQPGDRNHEQRDG